MPAESNRNSNTGSILDWMHQCELSCPGSAATALIVVYIARVRGSHTIKLRRSDTANYGAKHRTIIQQLEKLSHQGMLEVEIEESGTTIVTLQRRLRLS